MLSAKFLDLCLLERDHLGKSVLQGLQEIAISTRHQRLGRNWGGGWYLGLGGGKSQDGQLRGRRHSASLDKDKLLDKMQGKAIAREDAPSERLSQDVLNFGPALLMGMRGAAKEGYGLDGLGTMVEGRFGEGPLDLHGREWGTAERSPERKPSVAGWQ